MTASVAVMNPHNPTENAARARGDLLEVIRSRGLLHFDEPRQLSSGEMSHDFIDAKRALANGTHLWLAASVICESLAGLGLDFDSVGGLTMGADHLAHAVSLYRSVQDNVPTEWFVVRKAPKGRGTNQTVEGAILGPDNRVLLVDDIVTTGGSIVKAHKQVRHETGAQIVAAVTMVDRSGLANEYFDAEHIPYLPVFTYLDLDIKPVGRGE